MPLNINAILTLNGPTNLNQILGNIRNQLGNINSNVNVRVNSSSLRTAINDIKQVSSAAEELGITAGNAVRKFAGFTAITGSMLALASAMKTATSEAIQFDKGLVTIAQVSGESKTQIRQLSDEITKLSTTLGVSSRSLLEAAITLKQAGLSAKEVQLSLDALAKSELAPSFENLKNTTEGAIAIFGQFGRSAKDLEKDLSAINEVANQYAVESGDLIAAIRRSGGAFKAVGGDLNEFLALFTSVRATTRESAESIATGLRTIFTRLQRKDTVEGLRELGIVLRYTKEEAEALGDVNLRDQFVGGYEAVKRLSDALKNLPPSDPRVSGIIEQLGGYRQISKVIPLIQQFGKAQEAYSVAQASANSLSIAAEKGQESYANKIQKVNEQFKALFRTVVSSNAFQGFVETGLKLATAFIKIADALTPLIPLLTTLATIKFASSLAGFASGAFKGLSGAAVPTGRRFASGGIVPGSGNTDSVPAQLTPGEFVIKKSSAKAIGYNNLSELNNGGAVQYLAKGGTVGRTIGLKATVGQISVEGPTKKTLSKSEGVNASSNSILKKQLGLTKEQNPTIKPSALQRVAQSYFVNDVVESYKLDEKESGKVFESRVRKPVFDSINKIFRTLVPGSSAALDRSNKKGNFESSLSGYLFENYLSAYTKVKKQGETAPFDFEPQSNKEEKERFGEIAKEKPIGASYIDAKYSKVSDNKILKKAINRDLVLVTKDIRRQIAEDIAEEQSKKYFSGGKVKAFATGGVVPGSGDGDTVPARLTPGEFVIKKSSAQAIGYDKLHALNDGGLAKGYAGGGNVEKLKSLYKYRYQQSGLQGIATSGINVDKSLDLGGANPQSLAALAGAGAGDSARILPGLGSGFGVFISGKDNSYSAYRNISGSGDVKNTAIEVDASKRKGGIGGDVYLRQLNAAIEQGISRISLKADRSADYPDGYYVWPVKFGANGQIPQTTKQKAAGTAFANAASVQDLLRIPGGAQFWRENGDAFNAQISLDDPKVLALGIRRLNRKVGKYYDGGNVQHFALGGAADVYGGVKQTFRLRDNISQNFSGIDATRLRIAAGFDAKEKRRILENTNHPFYDEVLKLEGTLTDDIDLKTGRQRSANFTPQSQSKKVLDEYSKAAKAQYKNKKVTGDTLYLPVDTKYMGLITQGSAIEAGTRDFRSSINGEITNKSGAKVKSYLQAAGIKTIAGAVDTHVVSSETSKAYRDNFEARIEAGINNLLKREFPGTSRNIDLKLPKQDLESVSGHVFEKYISGLTQTQATGSVDSFDFNNGLNKKLEYFPFLHPSKVRATYADVKLNYRKGYVLDVGKKYLKTISQDGRLQKILGVTEEDAKKAAEGNKPRTKLAFGGAAKGTDTVPAMLTPGEFVINKDSAAKIGSANLNLMNKTGKIHHYASGGPVQYLAGGSTEPIKGVNSEFLSSAELLAKAIDRAITQALKTGVPYDAKQLRKEQQKEVSSQKSAAVRRQLIEEFPELTQTSEGRDILKQKRRDILRSQSTKYSVSKEGLIEGYQKNIPKDSLTGIIEQRANKEIAEKAKKGPISDATRLEALVNAEAVTKKEYIEAVTRQIKQANKNIATEEAVRIANEQYVKDRKSESAQKIKNGRLAGTNSLGGKDADFSYKGTLQTYGLGGLFRGKSLTPEEQQQQFQKQELRARRAQTALLASSTVGSALTAGINEFAPKIDVANPDDVNETAGGYAKVSGLATGATAGAALGAAFGPLGIAAGAAAGGLYGFLSATRDVEKQLKDIEISKNAINLNKKLEALSSGLTKINESSLSGVVKDLGTQDDAIAEKNAIASTNIFGRINSKSAIAKTEADKISSYQQSFPALQNIANQNLDQIIKARTASGGKDLSLSNPEGSGLNKVLEDFKRKGDGFGQKFLEIQSKLTKVPVSELEEALRKQIVNINRLAISEKATKEGGKAEARLATGFQGLAVALQGVTSSLSKLEDKTNSLAAAFEGSLTVFRGGQSSDLNFGTKSDKNFAQSLSNILAPFGGDAKKTQELSDQAIGINALQRELPNILAVSARAGALSPESIVGNVQSSVGDLKVPKELSTILDRSLRSLPPEELQQKIATDPNEAAKFLLKDFQPVIDAINSMAKSLEEQSGKFQNGLIRYQQQQNSILQEKSKVDQLVLNAEKQGAILKATKQGRSGNAYLDFLPLEKQLAPFQKGQERLTGLRGDDAQNPQKIVERFNELQAKINTTKAEIEKPGGAQNTDAQARLKDLENAANNAKQALKNLADSSEKAAAVQERLSAVTQDRDSRRSFGKAFLTASASERAELNQGALLTQAAANRGNSLAGFSTTNIQKVFKYLDALGDATINVNGEKISARDYQNKLIDNDPRLAGIGITKKNDEITKLQEAMKGIADKQVEAQKAYVDLQSKASDEYLDKLKKTNNEFTEKLKEVFDKQIQAQAKVQLTQEQSKLGELEKKQKGINTLDNKFGIKDEKEFSKVTKHLDDITKYTAITEQRSKLEEKSTTAQQKINTGVLGNSFGGALGLSGWFNKNSKSINLDKASTNLGTHLKGLGLDEVSVEDAIEQFKADVKKFTSSNSIGGADRSLNVVKDASKLEQALIDAVKKAYQTEGQVTFQRQKDLKDKITGGDDGISQDVLDRVSGSLVEFKKIADTLKPEDFTATSVAIKELTESIRDLKKTAGLEGKEDKVVTPDVPAIPAIPRIFSATGGTVGSGPTSPHARGTDTVDAVLTPGEFVVNRAAAQANLGLLQSINSGKGKAFFAIGGIVKDPELEAEGSSDLAKLQAIQRKNAAERLPRTQRDFNQEAIEALSKQKNEEEAKEIPDRAKYDAIVLERAKLIDAANISKQEITKKQEETPKTGITVIGANAPDAKAKTKGINPLTGKPYGGGVFTKTEFENPEKYRQKTPEELEVRNAAIAGVAPIAAARTSTPAYSLSSGRRFIAPKKVDINDLAAAAVQREKLQAQEQKDIANAKRFEKQQQDPLGAGAIGQKNLLDENDPSVKRGLDVLNRQRTKNNTVYGQPGGYGQPPQGQPVAPRLPNQLAARKGLIAGKGGQEIRQKAEEQAGAGTDFLRGVKQVGKGILRLFSASGGEVPGTDTVPAMLTPGEFVMTASATRAIGAGNLHRINRFAEGGLVGNTTSSSSSGGGSVLQLAGAKELTQAMSAFGNVSKEFLVGVTSFSDTMKSFANAGAELTKALNSFPKTLTGSFNHTLTVTINGSEAFNNMKDEFSKLAVEQAKAVLSKYIEKNLPDAGPVSDIE